LFKNKITEIVQNIICEYINEGDIAIDATAGNGFDTIYLAKKVGEAGKVYSFDVQKVAIELTEENLIKENLLDRVHLINDGHELIDKYVNEEVSAVMFNLGYLPKGDKSIITKGENTIIALDKSVKLLKKGGVISVIVYYGHEGGLEEKEIINTYLENLDSKKYNVISILHTNRLSNSPIINLIYKK
jgi:tRNA A58 N-methylase Trm61